MSYKTPAQIQSEVIEDFADFGDWRERFEWILEQGAEYQAEHSLKPEQKNEATLVPGCVSRIWLVSKFENGLVYYEAESEALIVQGLAALALRVYSGQPPEDILKTPAEYLEKTGLLHNLTPSRSNGVASLVQTIKQHAARYV